LGDIICDNIDKADSSGPVSLQKFVMKEENKDDNPQQLCTSRNALDFPGIVLDITRTACTNGEAATASCQCGGSVCGVTDTCSVATSTCKPGPQCGDIEQNVVYMGEDINNGFNTRVNRAEECRSHCQTNRDCVGWIYGQAVSSPYDRTCWIKNKLTGRRVDIARGWVSGHRDCGGYCKDPVQDVAYIGNDLNNGLNQKVNSLEECQALCQAQPNCIAVNWGGIGATGAGGEWKRSCWIKDSLRGQKVGAVGFVTAGRRNCTPPPCLGDEKDVVYFGKDLLDGKKNLKSSREDCRTSCQDRVDCNGWTWGGKNTEWRNMCWIKTSLAERQHFPGSMFWSGTRECSTATTKPPSTTTEPSTTLV